MKIQELSKQPTAASLNESLAKTFGQRINLGSFSLSDLENARNKVRTSLSQVETTESFDSVQTDAYQKSKMMLDVLNAEISEREMIDDSGDEVDVSEADEKQLQLTQIGHNLMDMAAYHIPKDQDEMANKVSSLGAALTEFGTPYGPRNIEDIMDRTGLSQDEIQELMKAGADHEPRSVNDPEEVDEPEESIEEAKFPKFHSEGPKGAAHIKKDRDWGEYVVRFWQRKPDGSLERYEPADYHTDDPQDAKDSAQVMTGEVELSRMESSCGTKKKHKKTVKEGEEDKAELVMAAKEMVNRVTGWMEDTAEMETESMLELSDAIRDELGVEKSESYIQIIKAPLEDMYRAMEAARGALTQGVGHLTGEAQMTTPMGADDAGMDTEIDVDADPAMEPTVGQDEFDAAAPAAGADEPADRAKRESVNPRRLAQILSKKN